MNIGYYHGYKGYRYINTPSNKVPYTKFEELVSIYDFDTQLKSLFYPYVMLIETALKNYVLDILVTTTNSESFSVIYNQLLDNYKMFSTTGKTYKNAYARKKAEDKFKYELKRRLNLRNQFIKFKPTHMATETKLQIIILERISTFQYGLLLNFLVWENLVILFPASTKTVELLFRKNLGFVQQMTQMQ